MKKCIFVYLMFLIDYGLNEMFYKYIFVLIKYDFRVKIFDLSIYGFFGIVVDFYYIIRGIVFFKFSGVREL